MYFLGRSPCRSLFTPFLEFFFWANQQEKPRIWAGSKAIHQGTAGFSPCFGPILGLPTIFDHHSHVMFGQTNRKSRPPEKPDR